ncbi:alpha-tocopherol transfer protein-like [Callorhinchus milii]|uniref:Tocopherol (alpha) transfer protein-like n=1 Tax=Callorhinchus milii TaxID=7868 RepID=A0A4W3JCP9_CALMI|nr:alpha-tocopherol transfer protein-like [Callorhinchus milii]XP_007909735.1 alpha-tocopherol transfer protein-like [Callorhinchus milii]XP_007909743.1 alpha-tocopherol transfer protein-like [Callorhinchus milii]XP_042197928.1 alpha-tocopherol transfer protein-like [Callorhinchus milii]|eukprot:gi/632939350/ref/XP_007909719.1/ PREDICTED: alpha-tocopherol transfer protein-like [Callorhinchus milii]
MEQPNNKLLTGEENASCGDTGSLATEKLQKPCSPHKETYVCTLSLELIAKAQKELQEKPEWRLRDVQALRDMILKEQPNLKTNLDDGFLLRFLRARKFDYDRALKLLVNYHSSQRAWPEVFDNLRPSAIKHVLDSGFLTVLPHRDSLGRRILVIRPGIWKPSDYPITDGIRAIYVTLEKLVRTEDNQVNGTVILADYNGVSLSQATHLGPFMAKKLIGILQDGFPMRIKTVNIINEPIIFKGIFAIIKPFLKEKMSERFVLHGSDLSSLHKNVPPCILPEEYGGTIGKLDTAAWTETLLAFEEEFLAEFNNTLSPRDESPVQLEFGENVQAGQACDESFRTGRSQLYYCY